MNNSGSSERAPSECTIGRRRRGISVTSRTPSVRAPSVHAPSVRESLVSIDTYRLPVVIPDFELEVELRHDNTTSRSTQSTINRPTHCPSSSCYPHGLTYGELKLAYEMSATLPKIPTGKDSRKAAEFENCSLYHYYMAQKDLGQTQT